ncbi:MAG: ankyrin repeat domain-containing protein [Lentisphaerae bacterium]|nr:ankyrin repeat domain-containing protein [Lentisphaerota bacterium]MCP4100714.1 ankyrin repeat domain-containing protein [Lentisphaerota bacterium]
MPKQKDPYTLVQENIKDLTENCPEFKNYSNILGEGGLCNGLVNSWGLAILSDDIQTFYNRIVILTLDYEDIHEYNNTVICKTVHGFNELMKKLNIPVKKGCKLSDIMNAVLKRVKKPYSNHNKLVHGYLRNAQKSCSIGNMTQNIPNGIYCYASDLIEPSLLLNDKNQFLQLLLSIRGFLDRMSLLHSPVSCHLGLEDWCSFDQSAVLASNLLYETPSGAQGIKRVLHKVFYGDKNDYRLLIKGIVQAFSKSNYKVYLTIGSESHCTGLYMGRNKVRLFNPNNLFYGKFLRSFLKSKTREIANDIFDSHYSQTDFNYISDKCIRGLATHIKVFVKPTQATHTFQGVDNYYTDRIRCNNTKKSLINELESITKIFGEKKGKQVLPPINKRINRANFTINQLRNIYSCNNLCNFLEEERWLLLGEKPTNLKFRHYKNNKVKKVKNHTQYSDFTSDKYYAILDKYILKLNQLKYSSELNNIDCMLKDQINFVIKKFNVLRTRHILLACKVGNTYIVERLLSEMGKDLKYYLHYDKLFKYAILSGNTDIINLLIKAGMDINNSRLDNRPPLKVAIILGGETMIKYMLERGADPYCHTDILRPSALFYACYIGNMPAVKALVDVCNLNQKNILNQRPIDYAKKSDEVEIEKFLSDRMKSKGLNISRKCPVDYNRIISPLKKDKSLSNKENLPSPICTHGFDYCSMCKKY